MIARNFSLLAWNADGDVEIRITISNVLATDYSSISEASLSALVKNYAKAMESKGFSISKSEIFPGEIATFMGIQASIQAETQTLQVLQYHTVAEGMAINIMMRIDSGEVTLEHETVMRELLSSMMISPPQPFAQDSLIASEGYEYRDDRTKTVFSVPINWSKANLIQYGDASDVFFTSNVDINISISYANENNTGNSNDVSLFEIGAVMKKFEAEGFRLSETDAVSYGGWNYQRAILLKSGTSSNFDFDQITGLFLKINGYMHIFTFIGPIDDPLYADFEQLMESVRFFTN